MKKIICILFLCMFLTTCTTIKQTNHIVSHINIISDYDNTMMYEYWINETIELQTWYFKKKNIITDSIINIKTPYKFYNVGDTIHMTIIKF